jgi:PAS domain S-box-containing protein
MLVTKKNIQEPKKISDDSRECSNEMQPWLAESILHNCLNTIMQSKEVVVIYNKELDILFINLTAANQLGGVPEEFLGKNMKDVLPEASAEICSRSVNKVFMSGKMLETESSMIINQKEHSYLTQVWPLKDKRNNTIAVQVVAQDITRQADSEKQFTESELRLRKILESSPDAITVTDLTGKVIDCNEATADLHGFRSREDVIGRDAFSMIAEEDREKAMSNLKQTLTEGKISNAELTLLRNDGSRFSGELSASVLADDSGSPVAFVGITKDITERKRSEDILKQSEERFRAVVEGATEGILTADTHTKRFFFANPMITRMLGYTEEELKKMSVKDIHPADALPRVLLSEGLPVLKKDGSIIYCDINAQPVRIGGKDLLLGFFRDMTRQKIVEDALKESEEKLSSIVNNAPEIILIVDREGKIEFINKTVPELVKEDVIGQSQYDYISPEYHSMVKKKINDVFEKGIIGNYTLKGTGPDGKESWYETKVGPLKHDDKIVAAILFTSDVTARRQAEEESRKAYTAIEKLKEAVFAINLKGDIVYANPSAAKLWGISSAQDMVHTSIFSYWKAHEQLRIRQMIEHSLEKEGYSSTEGLEAESKSGEKFILELHSALTRDRSGKPTGVVCAFLDITERKRNELEQAAAKAYLENTLASSPDAILLLDKEGRFTYVNEAMLKGLGRKEEEIIGKALPEIDPPLADHYNINLLTGRIKKRLVTGEAISGQEIELLHKDGTPIPVSYSAAGIRDNKGAVVGEVVFARDIREQKKAENEKAKLQQKLKEYAKRLELKVKKLEKSRLKLTEKEKQVFFGLVARPELNDRELEELLGLRRVTITAIRNRLKRNKLFRAEHIPDAASLGCKSLSIIYGRLGPGRSAVSKYLDSDKRDARFVFSQVSKNHFFALLACEEIIEFHKVMDPLVKSWLKADALSEEPVIAHFPIELSDVSRLFDFRGLLKKLFEQGQEDSVQDHDKKAQPLSMTKNMKNVLYALVKYPEAKASDISRLVGLTSATVNKNRDLLLSKGVIRKCLVPDLLKLNLDFLQVTHTRGGFKEQIAVGDSEVSAESISPESIVDITHDDERLVISALRKGAENIDSLEDDQIIESRNSTILRFDVDNRNSLKISFQGLTKTLLGIEEDF